MTNIVPFRQPTSAAAPHYLLLTTLVDPNTLLEEGDLVACCWTSKDGTHGDVLFWRWWGPTGRGDHGRFVKKGSPDEYYELDGLKYRAKEGDDGFKILGKVLVAKDLGERLTPPPKAS